MSGPGRIIPNTNRRLQVSHTRRKLFGKARQEAFLEHLAATCNVTDSAAAADICVGSVYRERMRNPLFREAWGLALEQGYARLEAALLARAASGASRPRVKGDKIVGAGAGIDGGVDGGVDEAGAVDWDKAMDLLRQHRRGLDGAPRRGGHVTRRVGIEALRAKVIKKLKAIGYKVEAPEEGE
jgi:hypothetical protein